MSAAPSATTPSPSPPRASCPATATATSSRSPTVGNVSATATSRPSRSTPTLRMPRHMITESAAGGGSTLDTPRSGTFTVSRCERERRSRFASTAAPGRPRRARRRSASPRAPHFEVGATVSPANVDATPATSPSRSTRRPGHGHHLRARRRRRTRRARPSRSPRRTPARASMFASTAAPFAELEPGAYSGLSRGLAHLPGARDDAAGNQDATPASTPGRSTDRPEHASLTPANPSRDTTPTFVFASPRRPRPSSATSTAAAGLPRRRRSRSPPPSRTARTPSGARDRHGRQHGPDPGSLHLGRRRHAPDRLADRTRRGRRGRGHAVTRQLELGGRASPASRRVPSRLARPRRHLDEPGRRRWDTTVEVDGDYDLRVSTTDKAGNVLRLRPAHGHGRQHRPEPLGQAATPRSTRRRPTRRRSAATATDTGTGIDYVRFEQCNARAPTCGVSDVDDARRRHHPPLRRRLADPDGRVRLLAVTAVDNAGRADDRDRPGTVDRTAPDRLR